VDGDGDLDVSVLCDDGYLEVLDDDGSALVGWQSSGWGAYPLLLESSPAAADLDGDDETEVLSVLTYGCMACDGSGTAAPGWPVQMEEGGELGYYPGKSSPSIFDLDGDGELEVVLTRHKHAPISMEAMVFVYDEDGVLEWSSELDPGLTSESVVSTPAVGDIAISREGNELVVCTSQYFQSSKVGSGDAVFDSAIYLLGADGGEIWSTPVDAWFYASPVVGDLDGDGENEIVVGTGGSSPDGSKLLVVDAQYGVIEQSWSLGGWVKYPAALGDLNGDGVLDFVVPCNDEYLYAWSGDDYTSLEGFPVNLGEQPGTPMLVDIDTDYELEVVFGTDEGNLWAVNSDGSVCTGFPLAVGINLQGCPAIGDIDGDCRSEIVISDRGAAQVYCYDMGDGSYPAMSPWRQFQHDSWHTGCFEADNTVPAPPTNLEGDITYSSVGAEVDLSWDLSVNDYYSPNPQDPADVVCYFVYREWENRTLELLDRVSAGDGTYTNTYTFPSGPIVRYVVTAFDGTNESVCSNEVRFHSTDQLNLALGRPVREVFDAGGETGSVRVESPESASLARRSAEEEAAVAASPLPESRLRVGNPECLTDGQYDERYTPSVGACAVVVDLGSELEVTEVIVAGGSDASLHAPDDRHSISLAAESGRYTALRDDGEVVAARYVHVEGAVGAEEILVYGEMSSSERMRLQTSRSSGGWSIRLPSADRSSERVTVPSTGSTSDEGTLAIYDIAGRRVWSSRAESGSTVSWDGRTDSGSRVPNGVYLVRFRCGSLVSTGRLEVMGALD